MKRNNASEYFPKNYVESRQRFLEDARKTSPACQLGSWKIPSKVNADLTVDYAWLAPLKTPRKLLVLLSGIHGAETYAGSAILHLFMNEILPLANRDHLGILMVHAMNPYGFKYHQRCTENHVNLNRNFSVSGELFKTKNPASQKMHDLFHMKEMVRSPQGKLLQVLKRENEKIYFGDILMDELIKSISPGQFERPEDVEYGGHSLEPQTKALMAHIQQLMPQFQDVIALDLHTGLGDRGRLHLLTDGIENSFHSELANEILHTEADKEFYVFTPPETEGFYAVHGATNSLFGDLAGQGQRVLAVTLEFGTLGHSLEQQVQDLNNLLTEHQGQFYGYANDELKKQVRDSNFTRSYPDSDSWRGDVLKASEGMLSRVISRL
jgi:hypothetical protein